MKLNFQEIRSNHKRNDFDCGQGEINHYLRQTARQHNTKGLSRTFVLVDQANQEQIIGFYTIVLCEAETDRVPSKFSKYPKQLPGVMLARMGVDVKFQGQNISQLLLMSAIQKTVMISELSGGIGLFVDAKNARLRVFYQSRGFIPIPDNSLHLFLSIQNCRGYV